MKRAILVHGWEGTPESNWFPWLKEKLEAQGVVVEIPIMPDTVHPRQDAWVTHLTNVVGKPDADTVLIGHSLGSMCIFRYLEQLPDGVRVGGVVVVAGFCEPMAFEELASFFKMPLDYEKVRRAVAGSLVALQSDNDPYVSMEQTGHLQSRLGAQLVLVKEGGHLNARDGFTQFPQLLDTLAIMETPI